MNKLEVHPRIESILPYKEGDLFIRHNKSFEVYILSRTSINQTTQEGTNCTWTLVSLRTGAAEYQHDGIDFELPSRLADTIQFHGRNMKIVVK